MWENRIRNSIHIVSEDLSAIAKIDETFISFSVNMPVGSYTKKCGKTVKLFQSMRFLDSYQFVSQSLEILQKHSKRATSYYSRKFFSNIPEQLFCKLTQKGLFPYSFLGSFAELDELLPDLGDSWKNNLTGKVDNTLHDYQHALEIYKKIGCTNLGDYHDVYLKTDVLLWLIFLRIFEVSA